MKLFFILGHRSDMNIWWDLRKIRLEQSTLIFIKFKLSTVACSTSENNTDKNDTDKALTIDSTMYIGSVSKQFCATVILLLREQSKLSVDDKLEKYFPEYTIAKSITIKNFLTMRSGITELLCCVVNTMYKVSSDNTEQENIAVIKDWLFTQPLMFEPDSSFEYSNSNFFLLANIVEQVSVESYNDFVRSNIFEPLDMTHTGFVSKVKDSPKWASGLTYEIFMACENADALTKRASDIASNASVMDAWMTGLSRGKIISKDSFKEMITDYSPDFAMYYGYGIEGMLSNSVGHTGRIGTYCILDLINQENGYNLFKVSNKNFNRISGLPKLLIGDLITE